MDAILPTHELLAVLSLNVGFMPILAKGALRLEIKK